MSEKKKSPPIAKIVAKQKNGDGKVRLFAVWQRERGKSLTFESPYKDRPGVEKIVLTNGIEITPESHWLDLYEEEAPF